MDPRRLAIFLAVVDEGGFSRASDELGISQPAVSQAVGELEAGLGIALFFRIGRSVRLTPAGEALVLPARQVQRDLQNARLAVTDITELGSGRLDLACLPTLAAAPLAPLVGAFRLRHPDVSISLADPEDTTELLEFVRSGRCEVGLVEEVTADDLTAVRLGKQDFLVVLPPGTVVSEPLPVGQLATMALVATPARTSTRDHLDEALRQSGGAANVVVEAAQREALLPLIAAGAGAGLLPRPLAELAKLLGCVVVEPTPTVSRPVAIVHRKAPLTPAAQRFVDLATGKEQDTESPSGSKSQLNG
jgi:DNA-binding transcriptional LysR family regulator